MGCALSRRGAFALSGRGAFITSVSDKKADAAAAVMFETAATALAAIYVITPGRGAAWDTYGGYSDAYNRSSRAMHM